MRTMQHILLAAGIATTLLAGTVTSAQAAPAPASPLVNPETGGRYAEYNGRTIDMSQGWQGAEICVEQSDTSFRCYDDDADYRAGEGLATTAEGPSTKARNDCSTSHICLWDDRDFAGKRVEFKSLGAHYLSDVGFRNRANSYYNRRSRITALIDFCCSGAAYIFAGSYTYREELSKYDGGRPDYEGSWNNKIDAVTLTEDN